MRPSATFWPPQKKAFWRFGFILRRFFTMSSDDFSGVKPIQLAASFAKVKRSYAQTQDVNSLISATYGNGGYTVGSHLNADGTQEAWVFQFEAVPEDLPIMIGEVLHNLRTALDHLAVALAVQHSGSSSGVYFPFGKSKDIFENEVRRKTKKLPRDAVNLIRSLKPYKGGNDLLWSIHDLNREDKHIRLAPFVVNFGMLFSTLIVYDSAFSVTGNRRGQHLATKLGHEMLRKGPDPVIGKNEYEFLTLAPGGKFEGDFKPTINISLAEVPSAKNQPVAAVLNQMSNLTERILLTFKRRFFS